MHRGILRPRSFSHSGYVGARGRLPRTSNKCRTAKSQCQGLKKCYFTKSRICCLLVLCLCRIGGIASSFLDPSRIRCRLSAVCEVLDRNLMSFGSAVRGRWTAAAVVGAPRRKKPFPHSRSSWRTPPQIRNLASLPAPGLLVLRLLSLSPCRICCPRA